MKLSVFLKGFPFKKALVAVLLTLLLVQEISLRADPFLHSFKRLVLSDQFFSEGACFADIDGDGSRDVISGPYWYAGPGFRQRHAYAPAATLDIRGYSEFFFSFAYDFNSDGLVDILAVAMPGRVAHWYENSGRKDGHWKRHAAIDDVGNESPAFVDLTGDGRPELVCCRGGAFGYAGPTVEKPRAAWRFTPITPARGYGGFTHGLGVGDVDGDGRLDLLETNGWWRQGEEPGELFEFHPVRFARSGGAQMFAYDFDGDGDNDVLSVQNAHGYGLSWFEQLVGPDGERSFRESPIITSRPADSPYGLSISQMHAVALVDIDGDEVLDIVTGKRFWAHAGGDTGSQQLPVLYWFKTIRSPSGVSFEPWLVDDRSGVGTQLVVGDVSGNGLSDIVVGSKMGTYLMLNEAREVTAEQYHQARPKRRREMAHTPGTHLFSNHVRPTHPKTPAEELASFTFPEGFHVQLFASEPQINKPLNLAFDTRGRLWVSNTLEYPHPVGLEKKGRDTIRVLEDTDSDGRADKVTTFADGLNIPMGLYPYGDGVVCFSVPNIWYLRDTDGDGRADLRQKLYGPLGYERDTHGMCNSFTRGLDGWLYACHGFSNITEVAGTDGHRIRLHSGNVFRMRLDGSRVERFSNGQVNPFGLAFDRFGDFFSADCHTKPLSLLIQDGYHESFGAPHDGLGFVPAIMNHNHGSTAICGVVLGSSTAFGSLYSDSAFGGNVTTCRINRNTLVRNGSSLRAREEPDFLVSGDPWFRPVYLQAGPDGALYVADFYNKIIGHYEVPLTHPGRDRHRGRIWKISYRGSDLRRDVRAAASGYGAGGNLGQLPIKKLLGELSSRQLARRTLALDELERRPVMEAVRELRARLPGEGGLWRAYAYRALGRFGALEEADLAAATVHPEAIVRVHAQRLLAETLIAGDKPAGWILDGFKDKEPMVRRAAVQAAASRPAQRLLHPLLALYQSTSRVDVHLLHSIRIALRNHLRNDEWFRGLMARELSVQESNLLISICLALKNRGAGEYILSRLDRLASLPPDQIGEYLRFASRYVAGESMSRVVSFSQEKFRHDRSLQGELLEFIRQGLQERGAAVPQSVRNWALALAQGYLETSVAVLPRQSRLVAWDYIPHPSASRQENPWRFSTRENFRILPESTASAAGGRLDWSYERHPGMSRRQNPWRFSTRRGAGDGRQSILLVSSFPAGEQSTGIFRSASFKLPKSFGFWAAGHDAPPGRPLAGKNFIRLRDGGSGKVLRQASPPGHDIAQRIEWDTAGEAGRSVFVELVDGNAAEAFAWLAVGDFDIDDLNPSWEPVLSSYPAGEQKVGTYRSGVFVLPPKFGFWIAGHDQDPDEPLGGKNFIRLRDALSHGVIRQAPPPRSDNLQHIEWDTSDEAGRGVYIELVDGNTDAAFAWLAVGGFSVAGLSPSRAFGVVRKGAELVGAWGLSELRPILVSLLKNKALGYRLRGELAAELARFRPDARLSTLALVPTLPFAAESSKEEALKLIVEGKVSQARAVLEPVMKGASALGQQRLARELSTEPAGAELLLSLVEAGRAGVGLLAVPGIAQNLSAVTSDSQKKLVAKLLVDLPPGSERLEKLIEKRKQDYVSETGRRVPGLELFKKACSPCHRVGKAGRDFAPNLDGVGNRGLDRLLEDILDPNRNVDVAFRSTTIVTRKGQVHTGLLRPADGQRLVLVDYQGREIAVALADVARRQPSKLSPMPANFSETLSVDQLRDLLSYLLSLRSS